MNKIKSYICILDWVDPGHAMNSAAHAGTMIMLKWPNDPIVKEWTESSIRKVTCKITQKQFDYLIQNFDDYQIITELSFEGRPVGIVFKPRSQWSKYFNYLKLWGKDMKGKFLSQNVVLQFKCKDEECPGHREFGVQELIDNYSAVHACPDCSSRMILGEECIIKN